MSARAGKLIVLDGLDGSGKTTQFEIAQKALGERGIPVRAITFPDYDDPSSALVRLYLSGAFSDTPGGVNAYAASSFYAVDRYASYKRFWERDYLGGAVILASRYVTSNAIHQMPKLDSSEWDAYLNWLSDYEYTKLGLPKPDRVIFLDMDVQVSQRLLLARYHGDQSKRDIHEANTAYLENCRKAALYTAKAQNWSVIPCDDGQSPKPVDAIASIVIKTILEVI